jgi:hypothetical protein
MNPCGGELSESYFPVTAAFPKRQSHFGVAESGEVGHSPQRYTNI